MHDRPANTLTTAVKAGYGAGQIAGQLFRDAPSLLLLFYLTSIIGMPPAIAGAAIFIPKVFFGAVSDLGIGILSDRLVDRVPRRRWLLIGAVMAPLAMVATFAVPDAALWVQVGYVALAFSVYMIAFSTFSVPYLAQFAEMTDDPGERTVLMAWKHGMTGVGVLLGAALTPVLIHLLGGGRAAYLIAATVLGLLCAATLLIAWAAAGRIRVVPRVKRVLTLRALLGVLAYRPFVVLCASAVAMTVAAGMSYASFAFFVTYNMARSDAFVQIGIISTIMAVVVMTGSPLWVYVARRIGKKNAYLVAAIGHALTMLVWSLSADAPIGMVYVFGACVGFFNTGWGLVMLSLLADTIAGSRAERGDDRAGSFSAVWTIIEKSGIALGGTLIAGFVLSAAGFSAALAKQGGVQPASALTGIAFAYGVLPGILKLIAAAIVWRFVPADLVKAVPVKAPVHAG
ncbi:MFS transporter [Sphingomonas sp. 4RDLI-65]|uniref:MFS transporter n=1 Tax=Sphingomonas sp. 4RDLI-65 TaxID=3111641 RepID=UPI003C23EF95